MTYSKAQHYIELIKSRREELKIALIGAFFISNVNRKPNGITEDISIFLSYDGHISVKHSFDNMQMDGDYILVHHEADERDEDEITIDSFTTLKGLFESYWERYAESCIDRCIERLSSIKGDKN